MKLDGLKLFQDCLHHPEKLIDDFYTSNQLIISNSASGSETEAMQTWSIVLQRITAAKVALDDKDDHQLCEHVKKLDKHLLQNDYAQFLEFTAFFNVIDMSYSIYKKLNDEDRIQFLELALKKYTDHRFRIYASHGFTPTSIQVRKDVATSRSSGDMANKKIKSFFNSADYSESESIVGARKKFSIINSGEQRSLQEIRSSARHSFRYYDEWSKHYQNKQADVVFSDSSGHIFICEMKHIKESGGAQDKQISELIKFIDNDGDNGVSYVAYLDGIYFNKFIEAAARSEKLRRSKISTQKAKIEQCLSRNCSNYFINTYGLKTLIG